MSEETNSVQSTQNQSMIAKASGLKGKDYLAYALGDTGCCLVFGLVTTLLQRYYTDVLLLHPLYIMLMFVVARVWDAINDPIMGRICDTVKTSRWGKYVHGSCTALFRSCCRQSLCLSSGRALALNRVPLACPFMRLSPTSCSVCATRSFKFHTGLLRPSSRSTTRNVQNFPFGVQSVRQSAVCLS